jgi:hypothetical protein
VHEYSIVQSLVDCAVSARRGEGRDQWGAWLAARRPRKGISLRRPITQLSLCCLWLSNGVKKLEARLSLSVMVKNHVNELSPHVT